MAERATIRENIASVEERVKAACRRSGRDRDEIRLIAVSKTHAAAAIREAHAAGIRDIGENRVQEAKAKIAELADLEISWHMLGHLQSNKAKPAGQLFQWIHSVDSTNLAEKLAGALADDHRLPVLIEVNLGGESAKSGAQPDSIAQLAQDIAAVPTLELRGLMAIPPYLENPEAVRPYFRKLQDLAKDLGACRYPNVSMTELSMGMSHDFEVAIEEGATMIRVGTAIFGSR